MELQSFPFLEMDHPNLRCMKIPLWTRGIKLFIRLLIYHHTHLTPIYIYIYIHPHPEHICSKMLKHTLPWISLPAHIHIYILIFNTPSHIYIHTHIKSCRQHIYPWPSLATSPYHSSLLPSLQGYIPYPHITAVCMFELVVLLLLGHMRESIGVHHWWVRPCFSSSVLRGSSNLYSFRDWRQVPV